MLCLHSVAQDQQDLLGLHVSVAAGTSVVVGDVVVVAEAVADCRVQSSVLEREVGIVEAEVHSSYSEEEDRMDHL